MIDVEEYEFSNGSVFNNNLDDNNKNKGKAKQVFVDHYNPFGHIDNDMMEIDDFSSTFDFSTFQAVQDSKNNIPGSNSSKASTNLSTESTWNPFPYAPPQSWDFYSGLAFPQNNHQTSFAPATYHPPPPPPPQTPDMVMMPCPPSKAFTFDGSTSSSRRSRRVAAEVVVSAQEVFLKNFKRFDTVEDFSDHHYASKGKSSKQVNDKIFLSQEVLFHYTVTFF